MEDSQTKERNITKKVDTVELVINTEEVNDQVEAKKVIDQSVESKEKGNQDNNKQTAHSEELVDKGGTENNATLKEDDKTETEQLTDKVSDSVQNVKEMLEV